MAGNEYEAGKPTLPVEIPYNLTEIIEQSLADAEQALPLAERPIGRRTMLGIAGLAVGAMATASFPFGHSETQQPHNGTKKPETSQQSTAEDMGLAALEQQAPKLRTIGLAFDVQHPTNPLAITPEFAHILANEQQTPEQKVNELHKKVTEGLAVLQTNESETLSTETLAWSIVTTIAAIGTLADMTKRGRVGFRDYAVLGIASRKAAESAGQKGIEEFDANLKDTFSAMGQFTGITLLSKLASVKPRDIHFHLKDDVTDKLAHEIHTSTDKIDQAVQILLLANLVAPLGSTQMATAALQPLLREFATRPDNTLNQDMIGTLQGNIANNLGLWRASLYPLANIASPIGGGMGPLKAIQTVKGDHVLQRVNLQMLPFQLGMNASAALQIAQVLHKNQDTLPDVHKNKTPHQLAAHLLHRSVTTPANIAKVKHLAEQLHIIPQHKAVYEQARVSSPKLYDHVKAGVLDLRNHVLQIPFAVNVEQMDEAMNHLSKQLSHLDATIYEGVGEIAGEDIRDIIFVLFLQSLAIPQISTVMQWSMEQIGKGVPEAGQELIKYMLIAGMSSSFDNYAAVNTAIRVEDAQIVKAKQAGLASCKNPDGTYDKAKVQALTRDIDHKRMHGLARSLVAGTMGGGILPPGNMANLPIATLGEYGIPDATQRQRLLARLGPIGTTYLAVKAFDLLDWYMSPEDPADEDLRTLVK